MNNLGTTYYVVPGIKSNLRKRKMYLRTFEQGKV